MKHAQRVLMQTLVLPLVIVGGCVAALWKPITDAREAARASQCKSNLHWVGMALYTYHEAYDVLPIAQERLANGRPAHSWRVMILPYSDQLALYERYDLTVPWDHANNAPMRNVARTPLFFGCPSSHSQDSGTTNYIAVVDESTAWPPNRSFSLDSITDDPSETILLIESTDSFHSWAAPRDLTLQQLVSAGLSSHHSSHVHAFFADFRTRRVRADVAPNTLRALLTVSGGENISPMEWQHTSK